MSNDGTCEPDFDYCPEGFGYYKNPTNNSCSKCWKFCTSCTGQGEAECTGCYGAITKLGEGNDPKVGQCYCPANAEFEAYSRKEFEFECSCRMGYLWDGGNKQCIDA